MTKLKSLCNLSISESLPIHRKRKHSLRVILDSIFWLLRVGGQWRNLPEGFPNWQLVYYYFSRWKADGTLGKLNFLLNQRGRERVEKEASPSLLSIDSQLIRERGDGRGRQQEG